MGAPALSCRGYFYLLTNTHIHIADESKNPSRRMLQTNGPCIKLQGIFLLTHKHKQTNTQTHFADESKNPSRMLQTNRRTKYLMALTLPKTVRHRMKGRSLDEDGDDEDHHDHLGQS